MKRLGGILDAIPGLVRRFAGLVIVAWLLLAGGLNLAFPQLERVVAERAPAFLDTDTVSGSAIDRMVREFGEGDSNNNVYVAMVSDQELGQSTRDYYADLITRLREQPYVSVVVDLWSDPVTAGANQSDDKKMAYVQVWLTGNMGDAESLRSVSQIEKMVAELRSPPGVDVYVTGPSAVIADEFHTADRDIFIISAITFVVIFALLLFVYRSLVTALLPLISVGIALAVARAVISALGVQGWVSASMFASSISAALILGAGTDYSIFLLGRYHEGRRRGLSKGAAYHNAYRGVNHIVVASALTIAGATACLAFAQIGTLQTAGIPSAIGILVTLAAALTLTPALVTVLGARGYLEPRDQSARDRRWRRFGTAIVRWPVPTFVAGMAVLVAVMLVLPTMRFSFDEVGVQPAGTPSVVGMKAFDEHFPPNQGSPEIITVTSDHDLRNPSSAIAIEEISRALARIPDVHKVVSLTRPTGKLLPEALLVNQAGTVGLQLEQSIALLDARVADMRTVSAGLGTMIAAMDTLQRDLSATAQTVSGLGASTERVTAGMQQVEQSSRSIETALTPLRQRVSASRDCTADPVCAAARTLLAAYDVSPVSTALAGLKEASAGAGGLSGATSEMAERLRASASQLSTTTAQLRQAQEITARVLGTTDALRPQADQATAFLKEIGRNFGASDSGVFYLPEQVFTDPRFAQALKATISTDGRTARFLTYGRSYSFGQGGIDRAHELRRVAEEAVRMSRLDGAIVQVGGIGPTFADIQEIVERDFTILVIVTLLFIFSVVLAVLRSLVAAITVVLTVAISFATAIGLSVLFWQHLLDLPLYWATPPLAFIALVAVGSDYNLLFAARFREEAHAGIKTGIIRAYAGTGTVVTTAGCVFAITMFALLGSSLTNIMQMGSTVGIGLLVDTFLVRAVIVPAVASHLGQWFWWPIPRREIRLRRQEMEE
ncbi:RND superfamily putative drug exporter [Tsukamurella ocularis]|uniref:MMPL/RND family transporter n=1 Tax=Tsukamurella ocularis TaxID=1970234 RepID=UPI002169BB5B|nr:RND family transporter [Tsukamurella ocularis]MCS3789999.1 RND superfamily putative drug exporter [Tsukamurella ocularis]